MLFPTSAFLIFFLVVAAAMAALETRFDGEKSRARRRELFFLRAVGLAVLLSARVQHGGQLRRRAADRPGRRRPRQADRSRRRGRGASGAARRLQVFRFFRAQRQRAGALARLHARIAVSRNPAAGRDQLFHVPRHLLHHRRLSRRCRGVPRAARHGAVHVVFSAARRRADRARRLFPAAARAALDRADPDRAGAAADPARAVQEGRHRELSRDRAGRSGVRRADRLRRAGPAARRSMATRCRSIAISAPIPTSRSRWRRCSASAFRPISTSPTGPSGCANSGSAGTSRCRTGCATTCT